MHFFQQNDNWKWLYEMEKFFLYKVYSFDVRKFKIFSHTTCFNILVCYAIAADWSMWWLWVLEFFYSVFHHRRISFHSRHQLLSSFSLVFHFNLMYACFRVNVTWAKHWGGERWWRQWEMNRNESENQREWEFEQKTFHLIIFF